MKTIGVKKSKKLYSSFKQMFRLMREVRLERSNARINDTKKRRKLTPNRCKSCKVEVPLFKFSNFCISFYFTYFAAVCHAEFLPLS